jgi:hypothetical protein
MERLEVAILLGLGFDDPYLLATERKV